MKTRTVVPLSWEAFYAFPNDAFQDPFVDPLFPHWLSSGQSQGTSRWQWWTVVEGLHDPLDRASVRFEEAVASVLESLGLPPTWGPNR